ncbi:MAG: tRNA lysidine(34) synthetase TilS [Clostridiaceae bacterium]|nr:tRNA lysidine(34) synthetase TilS [Clostridiaceae bacterium]
MEHAEQIAAAFYREYELPTHERTVVGFSGGADSTALLLILTALGIPVTAVHIHHGLRGDEADRDAHFCEALCARRSIPFIRRDVRVLENLNGRGIEGAARTLRYRALAKVAYETGAAYLAIAHNASDALETALFNLARGTGAAGLGIAPTRVLPDGVTLLRPILALTREEILVYLASRGESYVEDGTNAGDDAARNILRHEAIPALTRVNARAVQHALSAFAHLREDDAALFTYARRLATVPASAKAIADAPRAVAVRAIRLLYGRDDLTEKHIRAVLALCRTQTGHASVDLPGICAVREYDALRFLARENPAQPVDIPLTALPVGETTELPGAGLRLTVKRTKMPAQMSNTFHKIYVDSCAIHGILFVRSRKSGDTFRVCGAKGSKTLKKAFIEAKIPVGERDSVPVILAGDDIAAVAGLGVAEKYRAKPGTEALEITIESDKSREFERTIF